MLQLTLRQQTILMLLLTTDATLQVRKIAEKYHLSERTIRYDLEQIEAYLAEHKGKLRKSPGVGIVAEVPEALRKEILLQAVDADTSFRVLSPDERGERIVRYMLLQNGLVTADMLAQYMDVSRATILGDLRNLEKHLYTNGLQLLGKKGKGFSLEGREERIRRFMVDTIVNILPAHYCASNRIISNEQLKGIDKDNSDLTLVARHLYAANMDKLVQIVEDSKGLIVFGMQKPDYIRFLFYLAVLVTRVSAGRQMENETAQKAMPNAQSREGQLAQLIGGRISVEYGFSLSGMEIYQISVWLISCNIKFAHKQDDKILLHLSGIVDDMLAILKQHQDYQIPDFYMDKLKMNIVSHLKLTIKKHYMQINSINPLLMQMKVNYPDIFIVVYQMARRFEERTGIAMGEDEIGYIAIHIAAVIEECSRLKTQKAVIVCNTGRGAAMVLHNRICNNIPRLEIQGTISAPDVMESDQLDAVDLIISTIDLPDIDKPVFKVSPIITTAEINRINSYLNGTLADTRVQDIQTKQSYILSLVLQQTDKYVALDDRKKLKNDLMGLLEMQETSQEGKKVSHSQSEAVALRSAMILARLGGIAGELQVLFGIDFTYEKVFGLAVHIVMSIPRWEQGIYTRETASEAFASRHKEIYECTVQLLRETSKEYGIHIPDKEALAIMRYFV